MLQASTWCDQHPLLKAEQGLKVLACAAESVPYQRLAMKTVS